MAKQGSTQEIAITDPALMIEPVDTSNRPPHGGSFAPPSEAMLDLAKNYFPIVNSTTGGGVKKALTLLADNLEQEDIKLELVEVPSGKAHFEWPVPEDWVVEDAYVEDMDGLRIIDYALGSRYLIANSEPVDKIMTLAELKPHLHTMADDPEAVPYHKPFTAPFLPDNWGFCLPETWLKNMPDQTYHVVIKTRFNAGYMTYGMIEIKNTKDKKDQKDQKKDQDKAHPQLDAKKLGKDELGKAKPAAVSSEILIACDISETTQAISGASGAVLLTYLARFVQQQENRRFNYRFLFLPGFAGAAAYLSKATGKDKEEESADNPDVRAAQKAQEKMENSPNAPKSKEEEARAAAAAAANSAYFECGCVGDDRAYSYIPSNYTGQGGSLADRSILYVLHKYAPDFIRYSFLDSEGLQRMFSSPGIDMPMAALMRTKYGEYEAYHSSEDNVDALSEEGLGGAYHVYVRLLALLERNNKYKATVPGEPPLNMLVPALDAESNKAGKAGAIRLRLAKNLLAYADGSRDLLALSEILLADFDELADVAELLAAKKLLQVVEG